ncbi:MAG: tRNA 4-thiouridine(8) synthase ThiI [Oscillospiraceae bacterium]|nr:tRNA 4-thiouridine(8) synthase ThiI [Oscillospiraceae bacterium]
MHEIILCKLGEVVLKGLNRHSFEQRLMNNIRRRTNRFGRFKIYSRQSTIYVEPMEDGIDMDGAYGVCAKVFGIIAIARAMPCEKTKEAIFENARTYLGRALTEAKSFKVETKRADKSFPMSSIQLSQWVGGALHDAFPHLTVDVHHPELTVHIEIREDAAYVHAPAESAAGGLPIGMGGSAVSLLSGGIDSPVSSYMIAKRGVQLEMIHFASPPYTSQMARDKVLQLARELTPWTGRLNVYVIPFTEIQEEIRRKCPEDHFTLIMRRFMMRLADMLARELHCGALVTGENLGQVASQTMGALRVSQDVTDLPVLRPLIGMDKEEIVRLARKIGTFDTSILPYEDCCTVFTPRHPKTKPDVAEVRELESVLDVEGLCQRAMAGRELVRIKYYDKES